MSEHDYLFHESAGGTYNCRHVNDDPDEPWSLHAYAIAIDINPSRNKFGQCGTDMPASFTNAVKALRTNNGKQVFSWGGDWRPCSTADPMHFQIDCAPADVNTGIQNGDDDMPTAEEIRAIVRQELDRRIDGKPGDANKFQGIGQAVGLNPIGNSGLNMAQTVQDARSYAKQADGSLDTIVVPKLTTIEDKIDDLDASGSSVSMSDVNHAIAASKIVPEGE